MTNSSKHLEKFYLNLCCFSPLQGETHNLQTLHTILSTGSPLKSQSYEYVYKHIKSSVLLGSISGEAFMLQHLSNSLPVQAPSCLFGKPLDHLGLLVVKLEWAVFSAELFLHNSQCRNESQARQSVFLVDVLDFKCDHLFWLAVLRGGRVRSSEESINLQNILFCI